MKLTRVKLVYRVVEMEKRIFQRISVSPIIIVLERIRYSKKSQKSKSWHYLERF